MLEDAGLGSGPPGEGEWESNGILDCSMACWRQGYVGPNLQGHLCLICSREVKGTRSLLPSRVSGEAQTQG